MINGNCDIALSANYIFGYAATWIVTKEKAGFFVFITADMVPRDTGRIYVPQAIARIASKKPS